MPIVLDNGAVFLHIPKTGGSFVTEFLKSSDVARRTFGHIHGDASELRLERLAQSRSAAYQYRLRSLVPLPVKQRLRNRFASQLAPTAAEYEASRPFVFCFVREPLRWYESFWRYMVAREGADWTSARDFWAWHPCRALISHGSDNFADFVQAAVALEPGFVSQLYGRYVHDGVGFVGRQEHLRADLATALDLAGVAFDPDLLRTMAPSNRSDQRDVASPTELRDQVMRLEHGARVRFGYDAE